MLSDINPFSISRPHQNRPDHSREEDEDVVGKPRKKEKEKVRTLKLLKIVVVFTLLHFSDR